MISGALNWKNSNTANDVYKRIKKVYMLSCDDVVNEDKIKEIKKKNYSRIPVYYGKPDRKLIIGILLTKSLIGFNPKDNLTVEDLI